ncbi:MAG: sugar nucleotide-binding protein [bacterium]|nr:sugar nucleotide-binding protein [bacterium]
MKILLTGGSGLLGTELQKLMVFAYAPSHQEMDITNWVSVYNYFEKKKIDLVVHCAAYTAVEKSEKEKVKCWQTNVDGTRVLAEKVNMIYISTEYVFDGTQGNYEEDDVPNPTNYYSLTKVGGEIATKDRDTIIRCIFKPRPWKYKAAFTDQWTSGDYVNIIAQEIVYAISMWQHLPRILHIGTGRKSIYDLASQTREVKKISRKIAGTELPKDVSLNTDKWEKLKRMHL